MTTLKEFIMSRACKFGLAVLLAASMVPVAALSAAPAFAEDTDSAEVANVTDDQSAVQVASDEASENDLGTDASEADDERASYAAESEDEGTEGEIAEPIVEPAVEPDPNTVDPDRDGTATDVEFESLETTVEEQPFSFFSPLRLLFGASDSFTAPLASGSHAKWIDRLNLSDAPYGRNFYNILAEAGDGNGKKDWLIDFSGAVVLNRQNATVGNIYISPVNSNVVGILAAIVEGNEEATSGVLTPTETKVKEYINEIYGAYDRDYPTSFWRDVRFGTTFWRPADGSNRTYCLFVLKTADMDIRAKGYQSADNIKQAIAKLNANVEEIKKAYAASDLANEDTEYSRVKFYNEWLAKNNQYNTTYKTDPNLQANNPDVWSAASALDARKGANGPVCEGYSRALKVLLDSEGIGCVLVDGNAPGAGAHMWNYVRVGGNWYGVDTTWNSSENEGKSDDQKDYTTWLLKGSEKFLTRHPATNQFVSGGTSFTNGPVLNTKDYDPDSVTFTGIIASADSFAYGDSFALSSTSTANGTVKYTVTGPAEIDESAVDTPARAAAVGNGPQFTVTGLGPIHVTATLTPEGGGSPLSTTTTVQGVARPLKVTGTTLASKIYDGTTNATVATAGQLSTARPNVSYAQAGLIGDDAVSVTASSASYNDKNAGASKSGSATYKLAGDTATVSKYTLEGNETDSAATGSITKRPATAYFALTNTRVLTSEALPTGTVRFETATDNRGKIAGDNLEPESANIAMTGMPSSMPTDIPSGESRTYNVTWVTPGASLLSAIANTSDGANYDVTLSTDTDENTVELTIINSLNTSVVEAESPAGGATYRVEYTPDINPETVEALQGTGFSTRQDITDELMKKLNDQATSSLPDERVLVLDMVLYVKNDKGEDVRADENNFPDEGVRVTIKVPDVSNPSGFSFYAAHMFTHDVTSGGVNHKAGEVEKPLVTPNTNDISFTLMGFSPVSIAWEEKAQSGTDDDPTPTPTPVPYDPNRNDNTQTSQNNTKQTGASAVSQTGDSVPVVALGLCALACVAVIAIVVVRRNRKKDDEK